MRAKSQIALTALVIICVALVIWIVQLRRQLHLAEYYAQSGFVSVRSICYQARHLLAQTTTHSPVLDTYARSCIGYGDPTPASDRLDLIERLDAMFVSRRLPYLSMEPVGVNLPEQYVKGVAPRQSE